VHPFVFVIAGAAALLASRTLAQDCRTHPVSVSYFGPMMAYGASTSGSISAYGRYVAFESTAADLIANARSTHPTSSSAIDFSA
jgi:hypothetical protein